MQSADLQATCQSLGIEIRAPWSECAEAILTVPALEFLAQLHRRFEPARRQRLQARREQQSKVDAGGLLDFLPETRSVREAEWTVAPIPADLQDRRVEITGPVDRKMIINALNSGARVFMADFEDSNSPTWSNCLEGQRNLRDANRDELEFTSPEGKAYQVGPNPAVLMVRPRGWHLDEAHLLVDGEPIAGSLFDFGLYFFHNAQVRQSRGTAAYFYLPKLEHYLEARLWNDVFLFSQNALDIPPGSVRATVLIETINAAFQMDEILSELKDHSAGLNCGRWDYIFSFIKKFRAHADFVLPDRAQVTMDKHFLASYVELLIRTCHRRKVHAMGGMAAQIPIKNHPEANQEALEKVRKDKLREVLAGHDGTWVAHPGLIPIARTVFDEHMPEANQIGKPLSARNVLASDLLAVPTGTISEEGLRINVDIGIQYLAAWLGGNGCVPIYNLMEDAATAEISRSQVWQWIHHQAQTSEGVTITAEKVRQITQNELERLKDLYPPGLVERAAALFLRMMTDASCSDFLTLEAYSQL